MEDSNLKNMIILRNLPSNIVEEAIVILKSNKKVKKLEKIDKRELNKKSSNEKKDSQYILKEAEMLVSNYISKIENRNTRNVKNKENSRKYKRLKNYALISSIIIFIQALLIIIK